MRFLVDFFPFCQNVGRKLGNDALTDGLLAPLDSSWTRSWNACWSWHGYDASEYVNSPYEKNVNLAYLSLRLFQWVHPLLLALRDHLEARQECQERLHQGSGLQVSLLVCHSHHQASVVPELLLLGKYPSPCFVSST